MSKSSLLIIFIALVITGFSGGIILSLQDNKTPIVQNLVSTPLPSTNPFPYTLPKIEKQQSYTMLLAGDSMLASLGVNANDLRLKLISYYPQNEFVNYNYGFPATNIESLPERLTAQTENQGSTYKPIIEMDVDLIIIDSFGYNPLSQYPVEEGLIKQEKILDETIREIILKKPDTAVAIFVPMSPNKARFAEGVYKLSPAERQRWAEERISYIQNAINFAKKNNIPLINVYEKSLTKLGDGDLKYISNHDYIHPSKEGVQLIADTIAEFIYENKIFPE